MKPIYTRDCVNYVTYDSPETANIINESFWLQKKIFGIPVFRKRFRQDSNIRKNRDAVTVGFNNK